ncbi:hypothetical protein LZC95_02615 [Pendulispora brunnea]|uniref:Uncharacterized protein n=1 Tax=Pendulispora brunnea TaxID=2905690 RepID=A0ABZ2KAM4_9BACT
MLHRPYEIHEVRGYRLLDPDASFERLGPWDQPCDRFRATLTCVDWPIDVPLAVRPGERHLPGRIETVGGQWVRSIEILERAPCEEPIWPPLEGDHEVENLRFAITLEEPLPPAFIPYRQHPYREGELPFYEILERLLAEQSVRLSGVHESANWWAFGVYQIGSCGFAVARADARVTHFGSLFGWDDWIWAHERGLLTGPMDLVIESVVDLEASIALLEEMRIGRPADNRDRLANPPATYARAVNWRHIRNLRHESEGAFEWRLAPAPL